MSDNQEDSIRRTLIAYSFLPFLTPARLRMLREHFGTPPEVARFATGAIAGQLNISVDEAACVKNPLQMPEIAASVNQLRNRAITWIDRDYPYLLREIADPPSVLFVEGNRSLLGRDSIAVVGSRRASAYGLSAATEIARSLSEAGVTVVSGMARGIDGAAHRAAMNGSGSTVAVLGTGIDQVYPRSHRELARELATSGLIVTEFAPGTPPRALNFPIRNRIISGLTLGTVIVEATGRSGSLITARLAAEQGREVFAVPGPIFHPGSHGPHRLIQYGAKLVHDIDDIFVEIPKLAGFARGEHQKSIPLPEDEPLLQLIRFDESISLDELATLSGSAGHALAENLFRLESGGLIRSVPGGRYIRSP